jgi:hypothetical protein
LGLYGGLQDLCMQIGGELMAKEWGWDRERLQREIEEAKVAYHSVYGTRNRANLYKDRYGS